MAGADGLIGLHALAHAVLEADPVPASVPILPLKMVETRALVYQIRSRIAIHNHAKVDALYTFTPDYR